MYIAEITVGWNGAKRKIMRHAAKTRKEAQAWLTARLQERQSGLLVEPAKGTVSQFFKQWLDTTASLEVKPRTLSDYREIVARYIDGTIGPVELQKLTPMQIQAVYQDRIKDGLSPRTVQLIHAVLHRGLNQAVQWQLLPRNPADAVKKPRLERKQLQTWDQEQAIRFLQTAKEDRLYPLYLTAIALGLRQGELLGLRWSDIDWEAGTLAVEQTLSRQEGYKLTFGSPKTATSRRTIDLPVVVITALKAWRKVQTAERLQCGEAWTNLDLVFSTQIGTPVNPSNLRKWFIALMEKAGCPRIRFHDLRHTAATLMLANAVGVKVLQEILGHADIRMTLGVYSHVLREQKKEAAQKVDAFLAATQK